MRRRMIVRCLLAMALPALAAGCEDDVVMRNPRTGTTEVCKESLRGFDPYSQKMACVTRLETQGWTAAVP